jgi:N utilization substance protein A
VPERQLSLAIGKEGQNARLAAKLTGWRIDIRSDAGVATAAAGGEHGDEEREPVAEAPADAEATT